MAGATGKSTTLALARAARLDLRWRFAALLALLPAAIEREWTERRFFLWLPVAAGAGVVLYMAADREPSLPVAAALACGCAAGAVAVRRFPAPHVLLVGFAAVLAGFSAACLRTAVVAHPVLDRTRILKVTGLAEEVDHRRLGARFVLALDGNADWRGGPALTRIRVTTRSADPIESGDRIAATVRLVPPAHAALPGGYDFARDAYFAGLDAVGSVLGHVAVQPDGGSPSWPQRMSAGLDRARNALAARVAEVLPGNTGAIAAAMVTGKRDLLSDDDRELIREAGIFHIVTIAGVQMTLVAGLLFGGARALLACVPALALGYPIKRWAALVAMVGAVGYDLLTGSRVGTQRALFMTLVMLGAVLAGRKALTMRNLAIAALAVIAFEPEALLGASFQLSFAAVAALVAVQEWRGARPHPTVTMPRHGRGALLVLDRVAAMLLRGRRLLLATACASCATAPFMAGNFHDISPYVILGNPLTLAIIEVFAVPAALLGAVLYPLGLDAPVWHWLSWGIDLVLWMARLIAAAPGSTVHLPAFAPWALVCFALALCSAVIWRSPILKLTAVPMALLGCAGALTGSRYDLLVPSTGDAVAYRNPAGLLATVGHGNAFAVEQWLSADGDGRVAAAALAYAEGGARCDPSACIVPLPGDRTLSLVLKPDAFEEDCRRVDLVVTPLYAPASCAAEFIADRDSLSRTGALAFDLRTPALIPTTARSAGEDRPWSPAPKRTAGRSATQVTHRSTEEEAAAQDAAD